MMRLVELVERLPTAAEYLALLRSVGWPSPPRGDCAAALGGSLASVCALDDGVIVGMGRLVGDGRIYCLAVDVVVDPSAQGRGTVARSWRGCRRSRRSGGSAPGSTSSPQPDVVPLYRRLGYETLASELMRKRLAPRRGSRPAPEP